MKSPPIRPTFISSFDIILQYPRRERAVRCDSLVTLVCLLLCFDAILQYFRRDECAIRCETVSQVFRTDEKMIKTQLFQRHCKTWIVVG